MKRFLLIAGFAWCLLTPSQGRAQYSYTSQFSIPSTGGYLALDASHNFYLGAENSAVIKYDASGTYTYAIGQRGGQTGSDNSHFAAPEGIATNSTGRLFVADYGNNRVQVFNSSDGSYSATITGGSTTFTGAPQGVAADNNGNIYVTDGSNQIQKFDSSGTYLRTITAAYAPGRIAVDSNGNIFEALGAGLGKYDSNGNLLSSFGGYTYLHQPIGIAIDSNNNVFVTDNSNNNVTEFDNNGNFVSQFGSPGSGVGQLSDPFGIAIDASNNVFVVDSGNDRIVEFSSSLAAVPEPSSFILCGLLGASGFGAYLWRRSRRSNIATAAIA